MHHTITSAIRHIKSYMPALMEKKNFRTLFAEVKRLTHDNDLTEDSVRRIASKESGFDKENYKIQEALKSGLFTSIPR